MSLPATHAGRLTASQLRPPQRLLVVGGHGAVGRHLCRELHGLSGVSITVGGRGEHAARAFAPTIGAAAARFDVSDRATWGPLDGADAVVMCIDQDDPGLALEILERGLAYIDLTAGDGLFRQLEGCALDRGYALLSVGLAPGLTNLMAVAAAARLTAVASLTIGLMFGLGDRHGAAGLDWTLSQVLTRRAPGTSSVDFGPGWGPRITHQVDFADQFVLQRTGDLGPVFTGLCFDSRLATAAAFHLAPALAQPAWARRLLRRSLAFGLGSRACNVAVCAEGGSQTASLRFLGQGESRTTARIAALMVERVLAAPPTPGVWHSHQLFAAEPMLAEIVARGIGRLEGPAWPAPGAPAPRPTPQEPRVHAYPS